MGYDKYSEITTEYAIRGTYCDLGIKINDKARLIIEAKAIGLTLKDAHLKQVVDYAANSGIDWVILSNSAEWEIYKVLFKKPIAFEQIFTLNFLDFNLKDKKAIEQVFSISREGIVKSALEEFREEKQATNRYTIAALIMSEPILAVLKREIKKIGKAKIDDAFLLDTLRDGVLKRDVIDGEHAKRASSLIKKRIKMSAKKKQAQKVVVPPEDWSEQEQSPSLKISSEGDGTGPEI